MFGKKTAGIIKLTHQRGHQQNADTTTSKLCRIIYCPVGALNDDAVSRNGAWREFMLMNPSWVTFQNTKEWITHERGILNRDGDLQIATLFFPLTRHVPPFLLFLFLFLLFACRTRQFEARVSHRSFILQSCEIRLPSWRNMSKLNGR